MPASRHTPLLVLILVGYLMIIVDNSVVITGLPEIRETLHFSTSGLSWVQNGYTLAFGGLLLLGARAGDLLGLRRTFVGGLTLFTVASLLVGTAPTGAWLVAARVLQGIGAATLAPSTLALLTSTFPAGPERIRAIALYGSVAGIGAAAGLVLGGAITSWFSWRVGFLINVPIGFAMGVAALRLIPPSERRLGRFDLAGALSSSVGMTALVLGIVRSSEAGWGDPVTVLSLVAAVVLLAGFVRTERRADQPILPLRLFRNRRRSSAYAVRLLFLGAMWGFFFFVTQDLQLVRDLSPLQAGAAFLPMSIVNFAVALAVPRLTRRLGDGRLLAGGVLLTLLGMAWLSRLSVDASYLAGIALPMVLIGAGQGAALSPMTAVAVADVAPEDAGAASGAVNVAHQLGASVGLGVLVTVAAAANAPSLAGDELLVHRIGAALTVGTGFLAVALVLVLAFVVRAPRTALAPGRPAAAEPVAAGRTS